MSRAVRVGVLKLLPSALLEKGNILKTYYEDEDFSLYLGDAREILPSLPVGNCTIADPPYQQTNCAWDTWPEAWPLAVRSNSLWSFGSMRMFLDRRDEFFDAGWLFSQDIVWEKHNGSSFHADRFRRVHESPCHFYRGAWSDVYAVVPTTMDATKRQTRRKKRPAHMGHIEAGSFESHDGGPRLQRSVIFEPSCHGYAENETQKPVGILRPLIEYSCPVGGLVIDPFCGSGTTLVAAKELGRRAIGIDCRESQLEVAARRLQQEVMVFG